MKERHMEKIDNMFLGIGQRAINKFGALIAGLLMGFALTFSFSLMVLGSPFVYNNAFLFVFGTFFVLYFGKMIHLGFKRTCNNCGRMFALKSKISIEKSDLYTCDFCGKDTFVKYD